MNQTVVGVFDTRARAQAASEALEAQGFSRSAIRITDEAGPATTADADRDDTGFFESIGNFFGRMFGDDDDDEVRRRHVRPYAEAVRRGHCVLRVDVDDDESGDRAVRVLENAGAVDVDERMSQWFGQSSDAATTEEATVTDDSVAGNLYTPTEAAPGPSAVYKPVMGDTPEVVAESEARRTHHPESTVGSVGTGSTVGTTGSRGPVRVYPRDARARTGDAVTGGTAAVRSDDDGFRRDETR